MARLDSVLSFSHGPADADRPTNDEDAYAVASEAGSDDDDDDAGFEFAFAPPLTAPGHAPADDLFAHGRILPAYPVLDRRHLIHPLEDGDHEPAAAPRPQASSTAPPSPDTYCAWAPRSAPGSPAREGPPFPKSASTGEARRFWRLRDLVAGAGGRSRSDGKEKFVFLQPTSSSAAAAPSKMSGTAGEDRQAKKPSAPPSPPQQQKQSKKKSKAAGATEMDMATAHRFFYGKQGGAGALPGGDRKQSSYLPYRTGIVGFFATAHALGRSHHPY